MARGSSHKIAGMGSHERLWHCGQWQVTSGSSRQKKVRPPGADWQPEGRCSPQNNSDTSGAVAIGKKYFQYSAFLAVAVIAGN
jgi:hypothetical protein